MGILCVGRHTSACGRTVLFLSNQDRIHIVEMCLCERLLVCGCSCVTHTCVRAYVYMCVIDIVGLTAVGETEKLQQTGMKNLYFLKNVLKSENLKRKKLF